MRSSVKEVEVVSESPVEREVPLSAIRFPLADARAVKHLMLDIRERLDRNEPALRYRVPVTSELHALAGSQRLSALQHLGQTQVPIIEVRATELLYGSLQLQLPPTEIWCVGHLLEKYHWTRTAANRSQLAQAAVRTRMTGAKHVPDELRLGRAAGFVARLFGVGKTTYERLRQVMTAIEQDAQFEDLLDWLDSEAPGAIGRAHTELCRRRAGFVASTPARGNLGVRAPVTSTRSRGMPVADVPRLLQNLQDKNLQGLVQALALVEDVTCVEPVAVPALVESISKASRALQRVKRLLLALPAN